eukprot:3551525-Amphidinium_carterae.3
MKRHLEVHLGAILPKQSKMSVVELPHVGFVELLGGDGETKRLRHALYGEEVDVAEVESGKRSLVFRDGYGVIDGPSSVYISELFTRKFFITTDDWVYMSRGDEVEWLEASKMKRCSDVLEKEGFQIRDKIVLSVHVSGFPNALGVAAIKDKNLAWKKNNKNTVDDGSKERRECHGMEQFVNLPQQETLGPKISGLVMEWARMVALQRSTL